MEYCFILSFGEAANLPIELSALTLLMLLCDLAVKWYNVLKWRNCNLAKATETSEFTSWSTLVPNQMCIRTDAKGRMHRERHRHSLERSLKGPGFSLLRLWVVNLTHKRSMKEHTICFNCWWWGSSSTHPPHLFPSFRS